MHAHAEAPPPRTVQGHDHDQVHPLHSIQAAPTAGPAPGGAGRSPITTHVLDTALGVPAKGLPLALTKHDASLGASSSASAWQLVGHGVTNEDGR